MAKSIASIAEVLFDCVKWLIWTYYCIFKKQNLYLQRWMIRKQIFHLKHPVHLWNPKKLPPILCLKNHTSCMIMRVWDGYMCAHLHFLLGHQLSYKLMSNFKSFLSIFYYTDVRLNTVWEQGWFVDKL